ncbi:hypothetical protein CU102_06695 [Phyllobacterium brassicacearum]|uniref:Lipoprotein n=1 Tax=Phyllobacterium brassicacearum TaxID=314235 RepID=A0A2P7BTX9_9HYPH|nr:hypothetical protein [Phyllobacterium brassicacearum]PSH69933.1 hypothetical protein CU102_06695 [Phyllobacterium brassicacearum]TDQ35112.1 hypothetical protein DEV91_102314 [Phyllobacterium brassicacearum]
MKILISAVIGAGLVLTGCQTKQISEMSYKEVQSFASMIDKRCRPQVRTKAEYQMCIRQEITMEQTKRHQTRQAIRQGFAAAAEGMQAMSDNYARQAQSNTRITCYTSGAYTNCY